MAEDFVKARVNGSVLTNYRGRQVCVLRIGKQVDSNGTSFILTTSDNQDIKVIMQEPLNEYVSGLTEVHGHVDQRNQINCHNYINFPKEVSDAFAASDPENEQQKVPISEPTPSTTSVTQEDRPTSKTPEALNMVVEEVVENELQKIKALSQI